MVVSIKFKIVEEKMRNKSVTRHGNAGADMWKLQDKWYFILDVSFFSNTLTLRTPL